VLRLSGFRDEGEGRRVYSVSHGDSPASTESLQRVARYGDHLLRENELPGAFDVPGEGLLTLEVPASGRTFFHEGIVFAALDVFNDPVRNPTVTLLAAPDTKPEPETS
jgi:hypothetical protein